MFRVSESLNTNYIISEIFNGKPWGIDFRHLARKIVNKTLYFSPTDLKYFNFLCEPQKIASVVFTEITSPKFHSKSQFIITKSAQLSGFICYFHTWLSDNVLLCPEKIEHSLSWGDILASRMSSKVC